MQSEIFLPVGMNLYFQSEYHWGHVCLGVTSSSPANMHLYTTYLPCQNALLSIMLTVNLVHFYDSQKD